MLERKVTLYKPHGVCWRLSNDYFILDVDDVSGVLQGLYIKNDFNDANFMGNEENSATNVAWRGRYVKDMDHRAPMYGWTGDIFLKARLETEAEEKLDAMYTLFSDDIRSIQCSENTIICSYKGNSEYAGGFRNLEVTSNYRLERNEIYWNFSVKNCASETMVVGELGIPMALNTSIYKGSPVTGLNHRSVENQRYLNENRFQTHYLAAGHSSCYSAVRYSGKGNHLLIVPSGDTFIEAIGEEGEYGHEAMMKTQGPLVYLYSKSAARMPRENGHRELVLKPGEEQSFSFVFQSARDILDLKDKFYKKGKIDVKVIPGMVIPQDGEGKLLLRSTQTIHHIETDDGMTVEPLEAMGGHHTYRLGVSKEGELKVRIDYGNGHWTTLLFYGTPPLEELIHARAAFIAKNQQIRDLDDPCCYSFRSWDNDLEKMVDLEMPHGLDSIEIGGSDDRNFAPPVFLSAKNTYYPNASEVNVLDEFIENFLYGKLQDRETFTVKTSLFDNYETYALLKGKPGFDSIKNFLITDDDGQETTWRRWDYVWRIYNYPHAYNIYYNMYRIAKNTDIKVSRSYKEYLLFAYKTAMASYLDSTYADHLRFRGFQRFTWGNMSESHAPLGSFRLEYILQALDEEGMMEEEEELRRILAARSEHFVTEEYPFSSEYLGPGASTNHSPSYVLAKLVDNEKLKNTVVRMILSTKDWYPRWYSYAALNKFIGNYTTSLHAYPLLDRYEATGDDYLLQMAYGSLLGHWCCVDSEGKGYNSREWRFNPVDRDHPRYNFYVNEARSLELGIGLNRNLSLLCATLVFDDHFGVTGYGCAGSETEDGYQLEPWSGFGFKANIAPLGVRFETQNAKMTAICISKNKRNISIQLTVPSAEITKGLLTIEGLAAGMYQVAGSQDSRQYRISATGSLRVEDISSNQRIEIQAE